jgi:hypothetical protein
MGMISNAEIIEFVEQNISVFHDRQLEVLKELQLRSVLERKNPYLFRAKNLVIASDLVKYITDAFLVSREETNFGEFLERFAIFVCGKVYGGWKSSNVGMDLEFEKDGQYHIVSIKSGPNWGNSDQINRMSTNFYNLTQTLRASNPGIQVIAVNGCCYGKDARPEKKGRVKDENGRVIDTVPYLKLCGQRFWTYISGLESLYTDIVEPLGHRAKEKNEIFQHAYGSIINRFTQEFIAEFCYPDGAIRWDELVRLSSGKE